jgi:predicted nucleic acid-binding protein
VVAKPSDKLVAWDSCVILDCLQKDRPPYVHIRPLVEDAQAGKLAIVVSSVAIAEVFFIRGQTPEEQLATIEGFFDYSWVRTEAAGLNISKVARDVCRAGHKVDPLDAIHLATALKSGATVFLTYDGTAARKKKTPLLPLNGLLSIDGGPPLRILTPETYQRELYSAVNPLVAATVADKSPDGMKP